jgi:hypothetical protein
MGCGDEGTSSNTSDDISEDFGGFTTADESPYFGDADLAAKLSEDSAYDDSLLNDPEVDSAVSDTSGGIYAFRVVWGKLSYDSSVTVLTDWSGSLEISHGFEILRRIINFEPFQDYIHPRTDPRIIEWTSKTSTYHDGIFANFYIPASDSDSAVVITLNAGPFSAAFSLSDLDYLDTVYYLPDSNAVAIHAFKFEWHDCPKGFLAGHWGIDSSGQGIFYGLWTTYNGLILGHLKGIWGVKDSSGNLQNLFYGKYIDLSGNFQGLLKGNYYPHPNVYASDMARKRAGGWFDGDFYDANGVASGELRGRYKSRPWNESGTGFFHGWWKSNCSNDD